MPSRQFNFLRRLPGVFKVGRFLKRRLAIPLRGFLFDCWRRIVPASFAWSLPRGSFSLLEEMALSGNSNGRVILRDQGNLPASPDSLMVKSKLGQHKQQPWPIFWGKQREARLIGESLALRDSQGRLCREAVYRHPQCVVDDPAYWHFSARKPLVLKGKWTSIISRWVPTDRPISYAHWMFDALPRLAALPELPPDVSILVPGTLQRYQTVTLELLGLKDRIRPTLETDVMVEEYYFSSPTAMIVCYDPYGVRFLRERFLPFARKPSSLPERILIRRAGTMRSAVDVEKFETYFQDRGWAIRDLAQMDLAEQIGLFASAKAICGIHGAGFTNCVWCQPGTKVIELCCEGYLSGCFEWLCQTVGAEHGFEIFPGDDNLNAQIDYQKLDTLLRRFGLN